MHTAGHLDVEDRQAQFQQPLSRVLDARGNTVDEMWDTFTSLITEGMNAFVPKHLHRSINSKKIFNLLMLT